MAKKKDPIRVTEHGGEALPKLTEGGATLPEVHDEGDRPPTEEEWQAALNPPTEVVTVPEEEWLAHERECRRLYYRNRRFERLTEEPLPGFVDALLTACRRFPEGSCAKEMTGWDPGDPADKFILETIARWEALPSREAFWTGVMMGEWVGRERQAAMAADAESQRRAYAEEIRKEQTPEGRVMLTVKFIFLRHGCPRLNELVRLCQRPGSPVQAKRHGAEGHGTRWEFTYKGDSWEPNPAALARTMQRWKAEA